MDNRCRIVSDGAVGQSRISAADTIEVIDLGASISERTSDPGVGSATIEEGDLVVMQLWYIAHPDDALLDAIRVDVTTKEAPSKPYHERVLEEAIASMCRRHRLRYQRLLRPSSSAAPAVVDGDCASWFLERAMESGALEPAAITAGQRTEECSCGSFASVPRGLQAIELESC